MPLLSGTVLRSAGNEFRDCRSNVLQCHSTGPTGAELSRDCCDHPCNHTRSCAHDLVVPRVRHAGADCGFCRHCAPAAYVSGCCWARPWLVDDVLWRAGADECLPSRLLLHQRNAPPGDYYLCTVLPLHCTSVLVRAMLLVVGAARTHPRLHLNSA